MAVVMLQLVGVSKSFGKRTLFEDVSWRVPARGCVGLVGPNGVGKTTLFKILASLEAADDGQVVTSGQYTIGLLEQEAEFGERCLLDSALEARGDLHELEAERQRLEQALSETPDDAELLAKWEVAQARFESLGGYTAESDAKRILAGLGFVDSDHDKPAASFSGGWRMRILLARLLLAKPDLLLLDEPSNHLDLMTLGWFESFISSYEGASVVISHDRHLLNRMVSTIAELSPRGLTIYPGNYDRYVTAKAERAEQLAAAKAGQDRQIAQTERFIERFRYKSSKAAAVQSRVKALEKVERLSGPDGPARSNLNLRFPPAPRSGNEVIQLNDVHKAFGQNVVYSGVDAVLYRKQRVALVGANGAGKSTLLKLVGGSLATDRGSVSLGHNVELRYFAQHQVDALDLTRTVLAELESITPFDQLPRCRGVLGAFGFRGEEVDKLVAVLSGGEKARLALAKMAMLPSNLLLLDEPTNHLDIESREILETALMSYDGTLVVVSHDRAFVEAVSDTVWEVGRGSVTVHVGGYAAFIDNRKEAPQAPADAVVASTKSTRGQDAKARKRRAAELRNEHSRKTRALRKELEAIEGRLEELEATLETIDAELADPATYEQPDRARQLQLDRAAVDTEQTAGMERWESLSETLEELDQHLAEQLEAVG